MGRTKYWDGTKWVEIAPSAQEFDEHQAEDATDAHNATNISFTPPTGMTALDVQAAINEVFQTGNNVKVDMVDALLSVDPSLPITHESTWAEIETAAGQISAGKKWASGSGLSSSGLYEKTSFTHANGSSVQKNYVNFNADVLTFSPNIMVFYNTQNTKTVWLKDKLYDGGASEYANCDDGNTLYRLPFVDGIMKIPYATYGQTNIIWFAYE